MNNRQKISLGILLIFSLLNIVKWGTHFYQNPYQPIDFRTYYLSSKSFFNLQNPYNDSVQSELWHQTAAEKQGHWKHNTGFPHAVAVYAPQFVWFFGLYNLFDFNTGKWVQWILNLLALVLIVFCIKQLQPQLKLILIVTGILAFRGTWYAMDTGQPLIQVLAICLWSIYLIEKQKKDILAAVLLAFVSYKFTLLIPVVFYLLVNRHFRLFSIYFFFVLILNTSALIFAYAPFELIHSWRENISRLWLYTHSFQTSNGLNIISTSLSVTLKYFFDLPLTIIQIMNTSLLLGAYAFSLYIGFRQSARAALLLACLTGLCFGHHLVYDLLALICFILVAKDEKLIHHFSFYLLAIFMLIPIGSVADFSHLPFLNFLLPIIVLMYGITLVKYYLTRRNNPI